MKLAATVLLGALAVASCSSSGARPDYVVRISLADLPVRKASPTPGFVSMESPEPAAR
ncbi:hypothetical protein ACFO0A_14170 [Novosphingobium tardum]|uniref:Lipoprotein n=1 Tax=Novosphingobium tardum TaxID=1538021 RepID=A0ABV8RU38_9SPHN